jgi:hypothetical protein
MIRTIAALLLIAAHPAGETAAGTPHVLFRFADPRLAEASGIAVGRASPGVFYVQNDSGDSNRFFAVDRRTGATAATVIVAGARNVDWEDIAVAPDAAGTPSVWLADIGDNDAVRPSVQVYRVAEPHIDPADRARTVRVAVAQEWQLRYPGGPTDAEGLAVAPDGTAYLVTKSIGSATIYQLPPAPQAARVQLLRRVGRVTLHATGTTNPFGLVGQLVATGATIPADGSVFVIRSYADAWVWRLGTTGLGAALREAPKLVRLPRQRQGEGVAVAGGRLVVDSEGVHSAVVSVALPSARVSTGTPTARPSTPAGPSSSPSPSASGGGGTPRLLILIVLLAGGFLLVRTSTRARRSE